MWRGGRSGEEVRGRKGIFSDIFILIADLDKFKVPSSQYIERSKWLQVKTNLLTTMLVK